MIRYAQNTSSSRLWWSMPNFAQLQLCTILPLFFCQGQSWLWLATCLHQWQNEWKYHLKAFVCCPSATSHAKNSILAHQDYGCQDHQLEFWRGVWHLLRSVETGTGWRWWMRSIFLLFNSCLILLLFLLSCKWSDVDLSLVKLWSRSFKAEKSKNNSQASIFSWFLLWFLVGCIRICQPYQLSLPKLYRYSMPQRVGHASLSNLDMLHQR